MVSSMRTYDVFRSQGFRTEEAVDMKGKGPSDTVGVTTAGEYLRYTVNVSEYGTRHNILFKVQFLVTPC